MAIARDSVAHGHCLEGLAAPGDLPLCRKKR
jgi:hypothetical protein